jgi:hypothetical protein
MKEIYIPSGEIESIRSLVRYRHSLGEELTLKYINNMNKPANNVKVHGATTNLIYRGDIKYC